MKAADVATALSVSVRTVWRLRAIGALPTVEINGMTRFRAADIERAIEHGIAAGESAA